MMKTYCAFVLLLSLSGCCTAQSTESGDDSTDNVDDVETTVCINPLNVNNGTSTAIDNQTIALLYGKCLSICLVEVSLWNTYLTIHHSVVFISVENEFK